MKYSIFGIYKNGNASKPIIVNGKEAAKHTYIMLASGNNYKDLHMVKGDILKDTRALESLEVII